jgi:hypothetical protein
MFHANQECIIIKQQCIISQWSFFFLISEQKVCMSTFQLLNLYNWYLQEFCVILLQIHNLRLAYCERLNWNDGWLSSQCIDSKWMQSVHKRTMHFIIIEFWFFSCTYEPLIFLYECVLSVRIKILIIIGLHVMSDWHNFKWLW